MGRAYRGFQCNLLPEQVREKKSWEFSNLKQEDITIREYEQKFIQLERFAFGLYATERARASKFEWGLWCVLKD